MCGIVGILGTKPVAIDIVEALRRLEYRGYDSAGVATIEQGQLDRRRAEGKLRNLEVRLSNQPLQGTTGIGHTRWATHGRPVERNAHPHMNDRVAVVHNGIIENYQDLKAELTAKGFEFQTETDTETVLHLVTDFLDQGLHPQDAAHAALKQLHGAFALGLIFAGDEDLMVGARQGPPLAIGFGQGEMYLGSDAIALAPFTDTITYLEDGDWCVLTRAGAEVFTIDGHKVDRQRIKSVASSLLVDKGNYRHFMAKEIHEQPEAISHTLANYLDLSTSTVRFPELAVDLASLNRVTISACGTAYYAGLVGKYWIEKYGRLPVEIDVASEFRYREVPVPPGGLAMFVSQSGETADTLETLRYCKRHGQSIAAIVNVRTSTMARESDRVLPTLAGPEIGVASTKAFTAQLAVLASFALHLGRARGTLDAAREKELIRALVEIPRHMASLLKDEKPYERLAHEMAKARDVLYLGRGTSFPIALEGALKLKELSYIHAEGYAAGELKHGPLALIDENVPVVVVAPADELFDKTVSNMQEVAARGGQIILVSDAPTERAGCRLLAHIKMPTTHPFVTPLLYAIPMQLIAYHTAVFMGTDVDQPRNLAKSVTVE
jgi:glucosamine--fructose-6-phosphate aminotransferase (isomerizing)